MDEIGENKSSPYIGRYAPSPTGRLHLGNLRTALVAWLHARLNGGQFLMRIEDLDTPRCIKGSDEQILNDLEWLGLGWDGPVVYQSQRIELYQQALDDLDQQSYLYPCFCSRKDIRLSASAPHTNPEGGNSPIYPGTCSHLSETETQVLFTQKQAATRVKINSNTIEFNDGLHGMQSENLSISTGDFVLQRADGIFAYQLAVTVDDIDQKVSHVIRGDDLLSSTARQCYLAEILSPQTKPIQYIHIPLMNDALGQRMAKRDDSESIQKYQDRDNGRNELITFFAKSLGLYQGEDFISTNELLTSLKDKNTLELISESKS